MIKVDIPMPETCIDCPLRLEDDYDWFCQGKLKRNGETRCFTRKEMDIGMDGRQEWCPLIEE